MDSDSAGVLATLNATLALIAPNTTLPADFNVSSALHWLTMFNSSIAKGNATAVALMLKEFNITTPIPTSLATIAPLVNSTAAAEKAKMAKLAAQKAYLLYVESRFHTLQLFLIAGYGIMCALCIGLVCYLRLNRSVAFKGDASAARKIILPAFEPLLIVIGTTTGLYTLFLCVALATGYFEQSISKLWTEVFYSGRQFVFLSVVVFMLQKSVSGPALQRSMLITLVLSTYTLPIVWYMVEYGNPKHMYAVLTISRSFMLLLYTYIFVRPPVRASKRTLREFCVYAYIYYALLYTYNDLFRQAKLEPGFNLTYANLLCGSLCPLVIFRVLKADTEHWRGMGERAVALQELFRQKHNLPERVSSKGLHVLIEMHRKYIIDFAYLELKQRIGTGASAVVFNGILRHKLPVAVKVYTPSDFDEETVAGFSQEAALCGALHHPNIVKFYGMCVCPPTICLVSELCQGSLEDVMTNMAQRAKHPNRQQLLINIMYMLDAARAVAYLHSFSPAFLHRDIKPANFLVDIDNTVKLTDFGESRSLPRSNIARNRRVNPGIRAAAITGDNRASNGSILKPTSRDSVALESGAGLQQVRGSEFVGEETTRMTIKGTVDYMAPEIINGKAGQATYGEAADVFSLGITMWDIMHPGREKYPGIYGNHFKIFEAVSQGQRPELDPTMPASLRMVIESAWQADPRLRPSAQNIVSILETIQEEVAAVFALELGEELEDELVLTKQGNKTAVEISTFTGERAIEHMETHRFVGSTSEAVRLGNALLDAGLVHHLKHARPFENTTSVYFFDEDNINLCQPLTIGTKLTKLTEGGDSDTEDRMTVATTATRRTKHARSQRSSSTHGNTLSEHIYGSSGPSSEHTLLENGMCACRKLGQRLALPKALSRRRFRRNKYKAIAEESVLQASLLQEDHILSAAPELLLRHSHSEFEEFDSIHVPDARV